MTKRELSKGLNNISLGDPVEVVDRGVIVRGTVVECYAYTHFRIVDAFGCDLWVHLGQIVGRVP